MRVTGATLPIVRKGISYVTFGMRFEQAAASQVELGTSIAGKANS